SELLARQELCRLVDIACIGYAVPSFLDVLVMNLETILFERHKIAAIVVVIDPATPHFGIALAIFATVLRAILNEGADSGIDQRMVVPEGIAQVAFEQRTIIGISQSH